MCTHVWLGDIFVQEINVFASNRLLIKLLELGDHSLADTVLMKYAREEKWMEISSILYESN